MKIEYIKGNLFDTDIKVIVHGCNAHGVMGSGVARIVRDDYPEAYNGYVTAFKQAAYECLDLMGTIIPVETKGKVIVNAITQHDYGRYGKRYVSYDAVSECMKKIDRMFEIHGINEIAMPMIGAGLGGGNWEVISAIIQDELKNIKPYVYFYDK
jgi:O-acetyl-ADP-ribose deacetylase (regulator of RNase III)